MSTITADMLTENLKPPVQFWICGISKNEEGLYYCPYCEFKSDDIEDFATSMCWDCVYSEEDEYDELQQEGRKLLPC